MKIENVFEVLLSVDQTSDLLLDVADQIIAEFTKNLTARLREDGTQTDAPPEVKTIQRAVGGVNERSRHLSNARVRQ